MRFAGGIEFEQRQFTAIVHFDHFFGVGTLTGDKLETVGQVQKTHFAVVGVNAVFHIALLFQKIREPGWDIQPTFRKTSDLSLIHI